MIGEKELNKSSLFLGGDCSVMGLDFELEEIYWNIVSDKCILISNVILGEGLCVMVCSEDGESKVFLEESIVLEIKGLIKEVVGIKRGLFAIREESHNDSEISLYEQNQGRVWSRQDQSFHSYRKMHYDSLTNSIINLSSPPIHLQIISLEGNLLAQFISHVYLNVLYSF